MTDLENLNNNRRSFLKKTALGTVMLTNTNYFALGAKEIFKNDTLAQTPWYRNITRWGQINITEMDPPQYDIPWWRKFWKETKTQGIVVNAGGIVAYYPTQIPLHRKAKYLEGRDLFGELCKAAHEDGLVVFARMDSNRAHEDLYRAHPDWFSIDSNGDPYKAGELYITCVNGPYYQERIPAILTEISEMYHPEGFTDNSWSGLGRNSICYCENCKKSFRDKTGQDIPLKKDWDDKVYKQWIRWNYDRRLEIWDLNNKTTKAAGGPDCIWAGMNSGSISGQSRSFRDYKAIAERADIIMLDDQARRGEEGFQRNGEIGKLLHGILGWEKLIPESMALYQAGRPTFRLGSKPKAEARMWMIDGIAGGIQPWWHMVAAYHEDRRMYKTAQPIYDWHKNNSSYLVNRKPVANVGVVWSQENTDFYGRDNAKELVELPWRGMNQALIRARIPYLPVHADYIDRDSNQLSVLVLPNLAILSKDQLDAIRRFVKRGGSLVATGETSLYDEMGNLLSDYALSDLFGAHLIPEGNAVKESPNYESWDRSKHTYFRLTPEFRSQMIGPHTTKEPKVIGKRHEILNGFEETDILPYGGLLKPLRIDPGAEIPMTFIPQFPIYPPEIAYMREPKTDIPGVIIRTNINDARIVFIPADIDRQFGLFNLPDHGDLLANIVRWAAKDNFHLQVEGAGMVDCHLYQQSERLILHIVNLTNAATWRAPLDELINIGPLRVKVKLPDTVAGKSLRTLVSNQKITATVANGFAQFEIKSILDHEVVVIT